MNLASHSWEVLIPEGKTVGKRNSSTMINRILGGTWLSVWVEGCACAVWTGVPDPVTEAAARLAVPSRMLRRFNAGIVETAGGLRSSLAFVALSFPDETRTNVACAHWRYFTLWSQPPAVEYYEVLSWHNHLRPEGAASGYTVAARRSKRPFVGSRLVPQHSARAGRYSQPR